MFYYAQINESNFCNAIMESSIEENLDNLIGIEKYDRDYLNRKYDKENKKWTDVYLQIEIPKLVEDTKYKELEDRYKALEDKFNQLMNKLNSN